MRIFSILKLTLNFALGPAKKLGADVPDRWLATRKEIGIFGFVLVLAHMMCSLLLFGAGSYYGKFFAAEGGISAVGSWSMLFGVAAFAWLWLYNISFKSQQEADKKFLKLITSKNSLILAGVLGAGHITVMGYKGWVHPENWAGGMPPITMVAIAIFLVGFILNLRVRR